MGLNIPEAGSWTEYRAVQERLAGNDQKPITDRALTRDARCRKRPSHLHGRSFFATHTTNIQREAGIKISKARTMGPRLAWQKVAF